jgi:hypothetical protein
MPADELIRRCVRSSCPPGEFPVASPLPSTTSAAGCPALFGGFFGTTRLSDFPRSCIIAVRPWTSRCGRRCSSSPTTTGSPGSRTRCVRACTGSSTARGSDAPCAGGAPDVAFRPPIRRRHPEVATVHTVGHSFHGSIPGLHVPLSTLRRSGLPPPTHDSGPLWIATPSTSRTCIDNTAPISPAHIGAMKRGFAPASLSPG